MVFLVVSVFQKTIDQPAVDEPLEEVIEEKENEKEEKEEKITYAKTLSYDEKLPNQIVGCIYKIDGIPSPKKVSFSLNGDEFWVTSLMNKARGIVVFETENGNHKKDIVLPDGGAVEIIFNKDGSRAYVSQMETGRVFEIDAKKKEVLRTFSTNSAWTKVMAFSSDEKILYASNWSGDNVSVIDVERGVLLYNLSSVQTPRGIYPTKDDRYLYVAGFKNGEIQKIDLKTKESRVIYKNGGAMRHIIGDEDKGFLYISDMANARIYRLNLETDKVENFIDTENNPNTIEFTEDKKILVVSNRGINNPESYYLPGPEWGSILFFDVLTGEMLDAVIGGNQPTALSIYKNRLIYSNFLDGNVILCDIPSYEEFLEGNGGASNIYKDFIKK